jgi:hypothetical protein
MKSRLFLNYFLVVCLLTQSFGVRATDAVDKLNAFREGGIGVNKTMARLISKYVLIRWEPLSL